MIAKYFTFRAIAFRLTFKAHMEYSLRAGNTPPSMAHSGNYQCRLTPDLLAVVGGLVN
ncbi:hypothetical protein D3C72_2188510 [compost metagenome]